MPILLNDNFDISAPKPADNKLGPFLSTAAAISSVTVDKRYIGCTAIVVTAGVATEWWWKGGVSDGDFVLKQQVNRFTDLTDVPHSYSGQAGKYPVVRGTEDGLDFVSLTSLPPSGNAGGDLSGTYPNPTIKWANGYSTYDVRYVQLSGSYVNPSWLVSLPWSKITSTPTTVTGYGITDVYTKTQSDLRYAQLSGATFTGPVILNADPTSSLQAATKQYVDNAAGGIVPKAAVQAATTSNISLSSPGATIDGYTLVNGDRILVKDQTTVSQNGIYVYNGTSLTRATDMDDWSEVPRSSAFVKMGSTNANTTWLVNAPNAGTIDVTTMPWSQFSASSTYTPGTGLGLSGSQFYILNTGVTAGIYGSMTSVPVININAQGQITGASSVPITFPVTSVNGSTGDVSLRVEDLADVNLSSLTDGQLLKYDSASTSWMNWTPNFLTSNQTITLTGDVTGSGTTSITTTLASIIGPGTYGASNSIPVVTIDDKGRVTNITTVGVAPSWSSITGKPTTIAGYAITDAYTMVQSDGRFQPLEDQRLSTFNNAYFNSVTSQVGDLRTILQSGGINTFNSFNSDFSYIGAGAIQVGNSSGNYYVQLNRTNLTFFSDLTTSGILQAPYVAGSNFTWTLPSGTGTIALLSDIGPGLPNQTGNAGKYLTTDGTSASWATVAQYWSRTGIQLSPATLGDRIISRNYTDNSITFMVDPYADYVLVGSTTRKGALLLGAGANDGTFYGPQAGQIGLQSVQAGTGMLLISDSTTNKYGAIFSMTNLTTAIRTYQLPNQDGTIALLSDISTVIPSQVGQAGKFLTTNGSVLSWAAVNSAVWGNITGTLSSQTDLQNALNARELTIAPGTTAQYWRGDKTWQPLNAAAVGLGNVQNVDTTNASNITSGTLNDARLSTNVVFLTGGQTITGTKTFSVTPILSFLTGSTDRMLQVNSSQQISAPNDIVEGFTTDSDVISSILGATYNNAGSYIASITPALSKTFFMGQQYNGGGFHYLAVANNVVYRFGIDDSYQINNQNIAAQSANFWISGNGQIGGTLVVNGALNTSSTASIGSSLTVNGSIINVTGASTTATGIQLTPGSILRSWFVAVTGAGNIFSNTIIGDTAIRSNTTSTRIALGVGTTTATMWVDGSGVTIGSQVSAISSYLRLPAGTTTTSPLYIPGGALLSTIVNGSLESDSTHLYFSLGGVRYQLDQQGANLPSQSGQAGNFLTTDGTNPSWAAISSTNVTTALGYTPVTNARTLTINGTPFNLTADRSWTTPLSTVLTQGSTSSTGQTITMREDSGNTSFIQQNINTSVNTVSIYQSAGNGFIAVRAVNGPLNMLVSSNGTYAQNFTALNRLRIFDTETNLNASKYVEFTNGTAPTAIRFITLQDKSGTLMLDSDVPTTYGIATFSGDGTTASFTVTHNVGNTPLRVFISPNSAAAVGGYVSAIGSTTFTITFAIPPTSGTNNVVVQWLTKFS